MLIRIKGNRYEVRSKSGKLLMQVAMASNGYLLLIKPHGAKEISVIPLDELVYTLNQMPTNRGRKNP